MTRPTTPGMPRPELTGQAGMSLVETMVSLAILSIVMSIVFSVLVSLQGDQVTISSRHAANSQAQLMTYTLSRQVHAAAVPSGMTSPFVVATADQLEFYSALGNPDGPTRIDVHPLSACPGCSTTLVEDIVQPTLVAGTPTYTASPEQVTIGTGLVMPAPDPSTDCSSAAPGLFEYYSYFSSSTGTCESLDTATSPPSLDSSLFARIDSVRVNLTTVDPSRPVASSQSEIALEISLPNVDYAHA